MINIHFCLAYLYYKLKLESLSLKPISHHRLRPDKTVLSSRVGVGGVNTFATTQNFRD